MIQIKRGMTTFDDEPYTLNDKELVIGVLTENVIRKLHAYEATGATPQDVNDLILTLNNLTYQLDSLRHENNALKSTRDERVKELRSQLQGLHRAYDKLSMKWEEVNRTNHKIRLENGRLYKELNKEADHE